MSEPRLIALPYSPWSLKAKWALDHHRVRYRYVGYTPMLGEPLLRARLGRWRGSVTVPVLLPDGEAPIDDSADIARWADAHGDGEPLFGSHPEAVAPWIERSDEMLAAGRAKTTVRYLENPRALAASVPGPAFLWPALVPVGYLGAKYLRLKYARRGDQAAAAATLQDGLVALREAVADTGHVVGSGFTFADIAMAVALGIVRPPGHRYDRLDPHSRPLWGDEALAAEFGDLLDWRDALFEQRFIGRAR